MMLLQHLYDQYGLSCYFDRASHGTLLRSGEWTIYPMPTSRFHETSIEALATVSNYLIEKGESVSRIIATKDGDYVTDFQGSKLVCLAVPARVESNPYKGETLAAFHSSTQVDQSAYSQNRPYLNWSSFWQSRADQTYKWVEDMMKKDENTRFEEHLIESYPYYAGRAENAIQYIVDLMLDAQVDEGASFCHNRIPASYLQQQKGMIEWPMEWVIDHPGRDLGEVFRTCCSVSEEPLDLASQFIESYREKRLISQVGASLAYARLLFPLPFFETVEGYYSGQLNEEESLHRLEQCHLISEREEKLLTQVDQMGLQPLSYVDWLALKKT